MALLNINEAATTRLPLEPIKATDGKSWMYNGCIPTTIISVGVTTQKHEKGEFAGNEVPVLAIEFTNLKRSVDEPDKFATQYIKVVGSKEKEPGTDDQYRDRPAADIIKDQNETWKLVKHFIESLNDSPNYRSITNIPKTDLTTYFDLPATGTPADRLKAYSKFFTYIANFINGDGNERKSMIIGKDGSPLNIWVKMLPNYDKDPKRKNKYYSISRYIGSGVFEPLKIDKDKHLVSPRIIRVKATESLELLSNTTASSNIAQNAGAANVAIPADVAAILAGGQA